MSDADRTPEESPETPPGSEPSGSEQGEGEGAAPAAGAADPESGRPLGASDLRTLGGRLSTAVAKDLGALLSVEVQPGKVRADAVETPQVLEEDAPVVHLLGRSGEDGPVGVHLLVSRPDAAMLGALKLEQDPAAAREGELSSELQEAYGEVGRLLAALLSRLLESDHGFAPVQVQDCREVPTPLSDDSWLEAGAYWRLRLALELAELPALRLDVLLPRSEDASLEVESGEELPVLYVDAATDARDQAEDLGEAIGREVQALAPADLSPEDPGPVAEAGAVVVAYDLGGRSGIEFVEHWAQDARTAAVPVLVAAEQPTREMVMAALRAGARSFLMKPLEADELRQRLAGLERPPDPEAS